MNGQGKPSDFQEIIVRLQELKTSTENRPLPIPLIDPTANVKELVEMEVRHLNEIRILSERRQDDLREQLEKFNEKLSQERLRADAEAKHAESGRLDSLLAANTNNVALALEKQGAQASVQDRRIAILEQNQYQGVGAKGERTEGRQQSQWIIGVIIGIFVAVAQIIMRILKL